MEWDFRNVRVEDLLEMAAIVEQSGFDFYARLSARTDELKVRNELKFLRDEEALHKAWFLEQLRQQGSVPQGFITPALQGTLEREFIEPVDQMFASSDVRDIEKTLKLGAALEQKSIELYDRMRPAVSGPQRTALDRIIAQEEEHRRRLQILRSLRF
jgi:rubrerythrin